MSLSIECRRCAQVLTADTEDDLAVEVVEHARTHGHELSPDHILARIRAANPGEGEPRGTPTPQASKPEAGGHAP